MQYVSTRGAAPALPFDEVLLAGLAADGGLYLPESWPRLDPAAIRSLSGLGYAELATRIMLPFLGGRIEESAFADIVHAAYTGFAHPAVVPLTQLDSSLWLLELFHGPTLAFKDVALQLLARLYEHVLRRRGVRVTMLVATSGDTGAAAVEAFRDRDSVDLYVLHPLNRVSPVQRRQMTTVLAPNVCNIAIEGTFDDCQDLVKAMFSDRPFRDAMQLSAVNSINWARVMAQIVYYVAAAVALGAPERRIAFTVPTGNFGNVYAGHAARRMGLSIERLVVATNRNDILARFFDTGTMRLGTVHPTYSPSMDIQVSSNLERLLFELYDHDGRRLAGDLDAFRSTQGGELTLDPARLASLDGLFAGCSADDQRTLATIGQVYETSGTLVDPHTAVGLAAATSVRRDEAVPMVALATAHPAKFPEAVEKATGVRPELPSGLADLFTRPERVQVLPNSLQVVQDFIGARRLKGAA